MSTLVDIGLFMRSALAKRPLPPGGRLAPWQVQARASRFMVTCGARVFEGPYLTPHYDLIDDVIRLPNGILRCCKRPFYGASVSLHELVHWSGAAIRLNRPHGTKTFDDVYNREELVAELGAVLLAYDLRITRRPILPNAQYLAHYLAQLDRPDVALQVALSAARQSVSYLHTTAKRRSS